jgi:hypothetical protein
MRPISEIEQSPWPLRERPLSCRFVGDASAARVCAATAGVLALPVAE